MNQQLQQLFTDLDAIAGKQDASLAQAEAFAGAGRADLMLPHVNRAHDLTAQYGGLLRDAATWDKNGQQGDIQGAYARAQPSYIANPPSAKRPDAQLPPGFTVADVGSLSADQGAFDGTVNPMLMSGPNWGYYAKQNLGAQSGHIFDRQFTIGDPKMGSTYDAGTLAALQNVADPIIRDAEGNQVADLSKWG